MHRRCPGCQGSPPVFGVPGSPPVLGVPGSPPVFGVPGVTAGASGVPGVTAGVRGTRSHRRCSGYQGHRRCWGTRSHRRCPGYQESPPVLGCQGHRRCDARILTRLACPIGWDRSCRWAGIVLMVPLFHDGSNPSRSQGRALLNFGVCQKLVPNSTQCSTDRHCLPKEAGTAQRSR